MSLERRISKLLLKGTGIFAGFTMSLGAQAYKIFDIPGATETLPVAINNTGNVAGYFCCPARGFIRSSNGQVSIFDGIPTGLNDIGTIIGYVPPAAPMVGSLHVFTRDGNGKMTIFDLPQVLPPFPPVGFFTGINNAGEIAGYLYPYGADSYYGFLRDRKGVMTIFSIPLGYQPTGINARGIIAGNTSVSYTPIEGFIRLPNGESMIFQVQDNSRFPTYPVSLNNKGDVTGWFIDSQTFLSRGFIRVQDGNLSVFDGIPTSINEQGGVAGIVGSGGAGAFPDQTGQYNFLRDPNGSITLFSVPNALTSRSVSINNRGDIAGYFSDATGTHGFVRIVN